MAHEVDPYADKLIAITRSMRKIQNTFDQLLNEQPTPTENAPATATEPRHTQSQEKPQ